MCWTWSPTIHTSVETLTLKTNTAHHKGLSFVQHTQRHLKAGNSMDAMKLKCNVIIKRLILYVAYLCEMHNSICMNAQQQNKLHIRVSVHYVCKWVYVYVINKGRGCTMCTLYPQGTQTIVMQHSIEQLYLSRDTAASLYSYTTVNHFTFVTWP